MFYVASDSEVGVFGVEFDVAAADDNVRIQSVTFAPAFAKRLGPPEPDLPGAEFAAVRVQRKVKPPPLPIGRGRSGVPCWSSASIPL